MMDKRCINHNSIQVKELSEELGLKPIIVAAKIAVWQDKNNTDEFPSANDLAEGVFKGSTMELNMFNNKLEIFLNQFGFTVEQLEDLKEATGYGIIGATDFLEKIIFVQKENINQAYTQEAAYAIFNLLGKKNLLRKDLIASIHLIDNYESLKSKYINSKLSDYKIRELIAADYLQHKLIEAHKEILETDNKAVSVDVTAKSQLEYIGLQIKKWWSEILRKFFTSYKKGTTENAFNCSSISLTFHSLSTFLS